MSLTLHTTKGAIKVELNCEDVPRSAANFLALCASNAFDNTPFHRVIPNFIIQTGDPSGTGKVSRAAFAKRLPDEIAPNAKFDKPGIVAFANAGRPSSKGVGSQFFITLADAPHLDNTCTIVGKVIHGMDVVLEIGSVECVDSRPKSDIVVEKTPQLDLKQRYQRYAQSLLMCYCPGNNAFIFFGVPLFLSRFVGELTLRNLSEATGRSSHKYISKAGSLTVEEEALPQSREKPSCFKSSRGSESVDLNRMQLPTIPLATLRWTVLVAALVNWVGTVLWVAIGRGGLGSRGAQLFNWHPILASCAMLVLLPHGILSWRNARGSNRTQTKWVHAVLLITVFIVLNVAVSLAFFSHVQQKLPNFYSLHSWLGMLTLGSMKGNIIGRLLSSFSTYVRGLKLVSQVHRLSGVLACVFGFTAMLLGFAKEQESVVKESGKALGPSAIIGGALGLISLLIGVVVISSLLFNDEKKPEHNPEKHVDEEVPRSDTMDTSVYQTG